MNANLSAHAPNPTLDIAGQLAVMLQANAPRWARLEGDLGSGKVHNLKEAAKAQDVSILYFHCFEQGPLIRAVAQTLNEVDGPCLVICDDITPGFNATKLAEAISDRPNTAVVAVAHLRGDNVLGFPAASLQITDPETAFA